MPERADFQNCGPCELPRSCQGVRNCARKRREAPYSDLLSDGGMDPRNKFDELSRFVTVRYDLSPAEVEGELYKKLIEMGWTPPPESECRSPYCECEPGKCSGGRIDMRGR